MPTPRAGALVLVASLAAAAHAQPATKNTPLLQDDLAANRRIKIDAPKDALDAQLDAALGGPQGFSTRELEKIEDRIRGELRATRPRATPRLIVFLYPGRVSAEKLKSMSEVNVDIELVMDPCDRSVCRDAVARHIELVGRAVGQPVLSAPGYKLFFKTLTLKTSTQLHDEEVEVYEVPLAECVRAAQKPGGGAAWLATQEHAEQDYVPIVTKAIARHANERRVPLEGAPSVSRSPASVAVAIKLRGDRNRMEQQVVDAFAAAVQGLRDNPKSPSTSELDVTIDLNMRGSPPRRFHVQGSPVALYLDGRLALSALRESYIREIKKEKGAQSLAFDDADTHAGGDEGEAPDDNAVVAILSANFGPLAACAKAEAARSPAFRGVTLGLRWLPDGRATDVAPKEAPLKNGPLARCLADAVANLRLPKFSGAPRTIDYPIRVK